MSFSVSPIATSVHPALAASVEAKKPLVIILVDSSVYDNTQSSLLRYKADVEKSGFAANISQLDELPSKTPEGIRSFLCRSIPDGLVGAVLVGNVPSALYEVSIHTFPTDMFYMDLNGTWIDSDANGVYDRHVGDVSPEIWIGRIKPPNNGDEALLINNYFAKNHFYRNDMFKIPWWRALAYLDDNGVGWAENAKSSLGQIATNVDVVTDRVTTNSTDYKQRLRDPLGYQWLYLMAHGTSSYHVFQVPGVSGQPESETYVYSKDYEVIDPNVLFYLLFVCHAARHTEPDYLAGSIVFSKSRSLLAIGSTNLMFSMSFNGFFELLSQGNTIGTAFLEWLRKQDQLYYQQWERYGYQLRFYSLTMVGDPSLVPKCEKRNISIKSVLVTFLGNDQTMLVTIDIENRGEVDETFNIVLKQDYRRIIGNYTISIPSKTNRTLTFEFDSDKQFFEGPLNPHSLLVTTSVIPGEFITEDNTSQTYYGDRTNQSRRLDDLSPIFLAVALNIAAGLIVISIFKILSSGKLRLPKPFDRTLQKQKIHNSV